MNLNFFFKKIIIRISRTKAWILLSSNWNFVTKKCFWFRKWKGRIPWNV